jgi:hypothetical protein
MSPAASVLVCALAMLGRSEARLPPIELVDVRPPDASANAEAFVRPYHNVIYLITSAPVFRAALSEHRDPCEFRDQQALKKLASIIVHEEWHLKHGSDEKGAYAAQLTELTKMGSGSGSPVYYSVTRAMQAVLKAQSRAPTQILARR